MADGNGDFGARYDRMEKIVSNLLEHARLAVQRLDRMESIADRHDRQIEILRSTQQETNASVQALAGATRDLIDRIPPENLR